MVNNDNLSEKNNIQNIENADNDCFTHCFKNKSYKTYYINNDFFKANLEVINNKDFIQNSNYQSNNSYNNYNEKKEIFNIVYILKNNPNIMSYIHILDYLTLEELSIMFSFILKNIVAFSSNNQSFVLIDKIISIYNSNISIKNNIYNNIINENIYSFLLSFFNKRIPSLIHCNNYITSLINLVIKLGFPKNDFVYKEIKSEFKNYAYNRQGCILIQNLFPLGNEIQQQNLLGVILDQYNELIVDKYGHYLFKYLLYQAENGEKYYNDIYNKVINDAKRYTNNKYSSVVIERLLDSSNSNLKNRIIDKICSNEKDVVELACHAYGNYVLQKIINVTRDNNLLEMIYKTIIKNKNSLYKLSYGKKIMKEISVAYTLK